ncbi:hypothetical protein A167_02511 [Alcanivorax sp. S71-1-4]|jgi:uncharacterized protein (DUF1330 family)|uniref:DUF1330 domain-containing protein n=1 Tax=Alcanivorax sp. S71-1-4 TaxID=1177159 RepID=UPI00135A2CA8|nr:DUF1330 domain-containing protein [Alcanivorax sp. S71-1-4]KAF0808663.1 hypothetical protein A167_02511 [Alcanivorax sp. S71-1-4]
MTVYALAQISIHDPASYNRYQSKFMEVFQKYQGRLLAADTAPMRVEGSWDYDKAILMAFPDEQAFREWAESPEYQAISLDRKAGTRGVVILLHGLG